MLDDFDIEQFAEPEAEEPVAHAFEDDGAGDNGDESPRRGGLGRFLAIFLGLGIAVLALGAIGYFVLMNGRSQDEAANNASQTQIAAEATAAYEDALMAQAATETAFQFAAQSQPTATLEIVKHSHRSSSC